MSVIGSKPCRDSPLAPQYRGGGGPNSARDRLQDPQSINGDLPQSPAEREAYLAFHRARNLDNARRSTAERMLTRAFPAFAAPGDERSSPGRIAMVGFLRFAARTLLNRLGGKPITVVDLGCGSGYYLSVLEAAGYRGTYIGVDARRHPDWSDEPTGSFQRRLITADIHSFDAATLPPVDLFMSCTSLEHIRGDGDAVRRLTARLSPVGAQVHIVPAESALDLYGPHGWRQYSPRCVRAIFPAGTIYRIGGRFSAAVHRSFITRPMEHGTPDLRLARPRTYRAARRLGLWADFLTGNRPATLYGVIETPGTGA